jgi:hypothetical protein
LSFRGWAPINVSRMILKIGLQYQINGKWLPGYPDP